MLVEFETQLLGPRLWEIEGGYGKSNSWSMLQE
jgi:hypothetical protein